MKVIVIGGTGLIGSAVVNELSARHDVIPVGFSDAEYKVDIEDKESIEKLFKKVGAFDAVVMTTGRVIFSTLDHFTTEQYEIGLKSKLMGQVNTVLIGLKYINEKGSFTLTSGIINRDPIRTGSSASMVNSGIEGFVTGAAIEMSKGIRINVVSPSVVTEALDSYGPYFRGFESVDVAKVALAFSKSVEGLQTGQVYCVGH